MKFSTFLVNDIQLIQDSELEEIAAEASISLNRHVTWAKLILTDDQRNANKQRVPRDEFANVLKTGLYMPVKMAEGEISEGHQGTRPIGVISHLKVNGNTIESLAALWDREYPEEIQFLKDRHSDGKPIDVSWELTYTDATEEEDEASVLHGICMNAATLVSDPAYMGRTPVTAISSHEGAEPLTEPVSSNLEPGEGEGSTPEDESALAANLEGSDMDTITKEEHDRLMGELKAQLEARISELESQLGSKSSELDELKPKYEELANFKKAYDEAQAKAERMDAIKQKFAEAKLDVPENYFKEKADILLAMADDQIDFFVQELVAAFKDLASETASKKKVGDSVTITSDVPHITPKSDDEITTDDIVKLLREKDKLA